MGRLDDLHHTNSSTTLARYQYVFDVASRIEQITSYVDGVSDYIYDDTNQLTAADHDGSGPPDEDYEYDANGNRNSSGFDVDPNNQIASDGTYNYTYDAEGNRQTKTLIATGESETYAWDHRNRLESITFKDGSNNIIKTVEQTYDVFDRWVKRTVDPDGDGAADAVDTYFAYESGQIMFQWEDADGAGGSAPAMSHRYDWAEGVDQFLADEQITTPGTAGNTLWGLGDHLGTQRDILDLSGGTVSVVNHRDYNSFGSLTSETNSAFVVIFGYTSRPWDDAGALQNNLTRWYDTELNQWLNEDGIGFEGLDPNLRRYVANRPTEFVDPNGEILSGLLGAAIGVGVQYAVSGLQGRLPTRGEIAGAAVSGFVAGAIVGTFCDGGSSLATVVLVGGVAGGIGAGVGSYTQQRLDNKDGEVDWNKVGVDAGLGFAGGALGGAAGKGLGQLVKPQRSTVAGAVASGLMRQGTSKAPAAALPKSGTVIQGIAQAIEDGISRATDAAGKQAGAAAGTTAASNAGPEAASPTPPQHDKGPQDPELKKALSDIASQIDQLANRAISLKSLRDSSAPGPKNFIFRRTGGFSQAQCEFDQLTKGHPTRPLPGHPDGREALIGKGHPDLPEGTRVNVRPKSSLGADRSGGQPTIEIQYPDGRQIKLRYD